MPAARPPDPVTAPARQQVLHEAFGLPAFHGEPQAVLGHGLAGGDAPLRVPTGGRGMRLCLRASR